MINKVYQTDTTWGIKAQSSQPHNLISLYSHVYRNKIKYNGQTSIIWDNTTNKLELTKLGSSEKMNDPTSWVPSIKAVCDSERKTWQTGFRKQGISGNEDKVPQIIKELRRQWQLSFEL